MDLWMDVSKDDAGAVTSVVVGCSVHPSRSVFTDLPDAKYWINQHHRDLHHNRSSAAIRQIGDAVPPIARTYSAPMKDRIVALLRDNEGMTSREISDVLGNPHTSANTLLNRLRHAGQVTRIKAGQEIRWSLTNAT